MIKHTSSTNPTSSAVRAMRRVAPVAMLCLSAAGCSTSVVLEDAVLGACGTSTVFMGDWWVRVPASRPVENDPMGGFQFVYWVDDAGNACHGDPGRNGQVGPALVTAQLPAARNAAAIQAVVTPRQLKAFQEIPVAFANYSASGPHFAQFNNTLWRSRADGKTFSTRSDGVLSIPAVTNIGSNACFGPVAFKVAQTLFLPSPLPTSGQDPARCRVRAMPAGASMTEADLKKFDVLGLPHGTEIVEIP